MTLRAPVHTFSDVMQIHTGEVPSSLHHPDQRARETQGEETLQIFRTKERNTWTIVLLIAAAAVVMLAIALRNLPELNRSNAQPAATTESLNATATEIPSPTDGGVAEVPQHLYPSATGTAFVTNIDGPATLNTNPTDSRVAAVPQHLYPSATGSAFVADIDGPASGFPLDTSEAVTATTADAHPVVVPQQMPR